MGAFLVAATGSRLRRACVDGIEETRGRVRVWSGEMADNAAVICADTDTSALAARAGIGTPSALEHHVRFSLPVRSDAPGPQHCWIIRLAGQGHLKHLSAPGTWGVSADVDHAAVAWKVGPQVAEGRRWRW